MTLRAPEAHGPALSRIRHLLVLIPFLAQSKANLRPAPGSVCLLEHKRFQPSSTTTCCYSLATEEDIMRTLLLMTFSDVFPLRAHRTKTNVSVPHEAYIYGSDPLPPSLSHLHTLWITLLGFKDSSGSAN
ncbi:hypothetical protein BC629DRAFT_531606 [Irpex lacteus]|nr:hypothetical protein BC629DRAFT_531606 [Irpex lacteus]